MVSLIIVRYSTIIPCGHLSFQPCQSRLVWRKGALQARIRGLSVDLAKEMIESAMRDGSKFFEWTHQRLNGETFPATVLLTRVEVGNKKFLQATVRDITEQKKRESDLMNSLAEVEKINKLMVGRELAMVELKKRIAELEAGK